MHAFSQDNLSTLFESALPSVLKIETFDSNGKPLMLGTGFFISPNGKAISNLHVFKGASKSQITTSSGKIYQIGSVWYKTDSLDLVTFDIVNDDNEIFPFLKMAVNVPKIGEGVFVIGNPIGLDFTISNGIISSIRQQSELGQVIQTNAPISAGSSGSPLMNMNGLVVGVITYTFTKGQNLNFAISLLDKNLTKELIRLDSQKSSETNNNTNPDWIEDKYSSVRASHFLACDSWRFYIDMQKMIEKTNGFKWPINVLKSGMAVPIESYVNGNYDGDIVGTTSVCVVDKNLTYIISFGTDWSEKPTAKSSLVLVSRITNGEASTIFNYVVEKTRLNSSDNRFLENVGNSRISILIEDKIYVRSIQLEDHIENISFTNDTFYINPYELKNF
jgi:hypothetical protein